MLHRLKRSSPDSRSETIWLTIYADLITNLMLVFLALYGLTMMGQDALSQALRSMTVPITEIAEKSATMQFDALVPLLRDEFKVNPNINIVQDADCVRIQLGENVLFNSGQASLKSSANETLSDLSTLLITLPMIIVVEGHTDNVPIKSGQTFNDNRALSLARAMAVVRALVEKGGLSPRQIAAAAYGDLHPRSSNITAEGRRLNRRVEIALYKDFPVNSPSEPRPALGAS